MMYKISSIIENINNIIWGMPYIIILTITSIYLSIKLKFPQLKILISLKDVFNLNDNKKEGKKEDKKGSKKEGKITSFKSLMTILAGTLGTGNITGIAVAILVGGVGSLFWMFVSGILAMVISYAENYIVLANRKKGRKNDYYGGTMYVLDEILDKRKLAIIFAILLLFTTLVSGTMTQSNSLSTLLKSTTGIEEKVVGIILASITAYIVFGGKRRIAKISSVIIPICTVIYIALCLCILWKNRFGIIPGIKQMVVVAFGGKQIIGGVTGISLMSVIGKGFSIGMFSNEAGMGTAPMFTATVEENKLEKEARLAATSVVIDTLILCMLTGITILSTGMYDITSSSELLNKVFSQVFLGKELLNFCMVFFVLATIPCLEYYGEQAVNYLTHSKLITYVYRLMYITGIYIGSIVYSNLVWDLAGISNALMTLPNIYMIYCLVDTISVNKRKNNPEPLTERTKI